MEPQEYDDIIRRLTAMLTVQHEKNQSYDALFEAQRGINERLTASMERLEGSVASYMARLDGYMDRMEGYMQRQEGVNTAVSSTLARIEALLARVVRGSGNGREA